MPTLKEEIYKLIRKARNKKPDYGDLKTPLEEKDMDYFIAQELSQEGYVKLGDVKKRLKEGFKPWDFGYAEGYEEFCQEIDKAIANSPEVIKRKEKGR